MYRVNNAVVHSILLYGYEALPVTGENMLAVIENNLSHILHVRHRSTAPIGELRGRLCLYCIRRSAD